MWSLQRANNEIPHSLGTFQKTWIPFDNRSATFKWEMAPAVLPEEMRLLSVSESCSPRMAVDLLLWVWGGLNSQKERWEAGKSLLSHKRKGALLSTGLPWTWSSMEGVIIPLKEFTKCQLQVSTMKFWILFSVFLLKRRNYIVRSFLFS